MTRPTCRSARASTPRAPGRRPPTTPGITRRRSPPRPARPAGLGRRGWTSTPAGGRYPDPYDGAMFFADYSRDCIWAMLPGVSGGLPSISRIAHLRRRRLEPDGREVGPSGELFYPDFDGGTIRRVSFRRRQPAARAAASANPKTGPAPLAVQFNGAGSNDPDPGDTLDYAWDLDGDGDFDDSTAVRRPAPTPPASTTSASASRTTPAPPRPPRSRSTPATRRRSRR